jgi:hypothetical protein
MFWEWINAAIFLLLAIASVRKLSLLLSSPPRSLLWVCVAFRRI